MLSFARLFLIIVCCCIPMTSTADYKGKRVFILHSYHEQYPWTHAIDDMLHNILDAVDITSNSFYLDTKNRASETEKFSSAQLARLRIERFKPDVVITTDDDAVKYVLMPYFKDSKIPFVFCGVNWEASAYGLPYSNTTGMLEVELINEMVKNLQVYAKGRKIGTLALNGLTEHKWVDYYHSYLERPVDKSYFPNTFDEWKENFLMLQHEVDMIILLNPKGLKDFDLQQAQAFIENNIKVPTTSSIIWMSQMSLMGITLIPEEQAAWAAQSTLKILDGQAPSSIPITRNKEGKLFINMKLAEKLGITFKPALLRVADIIR